MMYLEASAVVSACGQFRYRLVRRWAAGARGALLFVMLNPSTADGRDDDPTVRRCVRFAADAGFDGLVIENLFAFRARYPFDLRVNGWKVGPENDEFLVKALADRDVRQVCIAWGENAMGLQRMRDVLSIIEQRGRTPMCLGKTNSGMPRHPLMLPANARLTPYFAHHEQRR